MARNKSFKQPRSGWRKGRKLSPSIGGKKTTENAGEGPVGRPSRPVPMRLLKNMVGTSAAPEPIKE